MNRNLEQKKISAAEEALKLKDEGRRLSYIIGKFSDYESEIREIFGIVAFIKENNDKISAPKNVLKTLLSKIPENSWTQPPPRQEKEISKEDSDYIRVEEDAEDDEGANFPPEETDNDFIFNKWKIIIPVIILAIVMGIILLRSDSKIKSETTSDDVETIQNKIEMNPSMDAANISSSTEEI